MYFLLQNCRFEDGSEGALLVRDGLVKERLAPDATAPARARTINVEGRLVIPAFACAHLHACKAFWSDPLGHQRAEVRSMPRFEAASHVKRAYLEEEVESRVDRALELAARHGTGALRLFCDVDKNAGLRAFHGLMHAVRRWKDVLRLQVVAFPQDGLDTELLAKALDLGATVLGGIPFIEKAPEQREAHAKACFDLAVERDVDLHFVVDDTIDPAINTLEFIARLAIDRGWEGRVAATQCASLAHLKDEDAARVIQLVKDAGITVVSNPHVGLVCHSGPGSPQPRGVTRWRELVAAGVPMACAQDDIDSWFYPFGANDPLQVGLLAAHAFPLAWGTELRQLLSWLTTSPAQFLGWRRHGLEAGCEASFVVLDAPDWRTALQYQSDKLLVVLNGRPVAASRTRARTLSLEREPRDSDWDYFLSYWRGSEGGV